MTCLTFHLFHHYYSPLELLVSARVIFTCACSSLLNTVMRVCFLFLQHLCQDVKNKILGQMSNFLVENFFCTVICIK